MIKQENKKLDEKILVLKRENLLGQEAFQGLKEIDFSFYQNLIEKNKEFIWRSGAETDESFKQIIPYLIFKFEDKFFLMQRKSSASEARLQNKYSFGIGGHIRELDLIGKSIFEWAIREFNEEVLYSGKLDIKPIGLLNDDSNAVGRVHAGFIILIEGNSSDIKVKSELKSGNLLTLDQAAVYYENMESWSQIVFDFLKNRY